MGGYSMIDWNCSKKPNECQYRFDYRGCNKENCRFPNEYGKKEFYMVRKKFSVKTGFNGYDFTFILQGNYYYSKEIPYGYGMACFPISYNVYKITKEDYENIIPYNKLSSKEDCALSNIKWDSSEDKKEFDTLFLTGY